MSFTEDKESDNYATDKEGWEMIKDFIHLTNLSNWVNPFKIQLSRQS